jgi:hypothetical protein
MTNDQGHCKDCDAYSLTTCRCQLSPAVYAGSRQDGPSWYSCWAQPRMDPHDGTCRSFRRKAEVKS